ncbi:hypothetical protein Ancab_010940, partial [Ancistrocladus abbreviatus]
MQALNCPALPNMEFETTEAYPTQEPRIKEPASLTEPLAKVLETTFKPPSQVATSTPVTPLP